MRIVSVLLFALISLLARDNPFKPVISSKNLSKATNIANPYKPLKLQKIKLPSSVRVIKRLKLEVINVDGSKSELSYDINRKIDWHNDLFLSSKKPILKSSKQKNISSPKTIKPFKFLTISIKKDTLHLITDDKLLRELYFSKPYKIALDLQRDVSFYTKKIHPKIVPFKNITIGNHEKFYRVVVKLDGKYRYKLKKVDDGYLLELF